jgi:uncharacterized protein
MGKFIFYLLLALLIYWLVKGRYSAKEAAPPKEASEDMVRCAYCDIYLPKGEAIDHRDEFFCCREHYRLRVNASS